jgi:hypothetical protein
MHHTDAGSGREQRIPVDLAQPLTLEVHNHDGDIAIRAADRSDVLIRSESLSGTAGAGGVGNGLTLDARGNQIEVRANLHADVEWAGIAGEIDLETVVGQIGKAFRIAGPFLSAIPGRAHSGSGGRLASDITVEVPLAMTGQIEVHATSGDVRVEGFTGEIDLRSLSGDLRAVRTGGRLVMQTASGDLHVDDASGRLTARTASGDVRVTSPQLDGFDIQTADGEILVDATLAGNGSSHAQTASGDVRLRLRRPVAADEEPSATLAFHTVSGEARVSFPFRKTDRWRWQSGSGSGGPHIDVTTVDGYLGAEIAALESAIIPASHTATPADELPSAPLTSPEPDRGREGRVVAVADAEPEAASPSSTGSAARLAVLEAVERGEIDVEEALRRLDATDAGANA